MSDPISRENLPTFTAVGFIVALIALVFGIMGFVDARRAGVATAAVVSSLAKDGQGDLGARVAELEQRLAALEQGKATVPPVEAAAAPAEAEAAVAAP